MGGCHSKKALKAALKKRRMEKLPKGQRASTGADQGNKSIQGPRSKRGAVSPVSSDKNPPSKAPHPSTTSSAGSKSQGHRLKVILKESSLKKNTARSRFGTPSSTASNPVSFHGRVLQKTASVTPAPSKTSVKTLGSLRRFGFGNDSHRSGDSTDSVNSILSDLQTNSDTNSNLLDFAEENGNAECTTSSPPTPHAATENLIRHGDESPCSVSQASSGVTSAALSGKIRAQSKQLPIPQTVTLKAVGESGNRPLLTQSSSNKLRTRSSPDSLIRFIPNSTSKSKPSSNSKLTPDRTSDSSPDIILKSNYDVLASVSVNKNLMPVASKIPDRTLCNSQSIQHNCASSSRVLSPSPNTQLNRIPLRQSSSSPCANRQLSPSLNRQSSPSLSRKSVDYSNSIKSDDRKLNNQSKVLSKNASTGDSQHLTTRHRTGIPNLKAQAKKNDQKSKPQDQNLQSVGLGFGSLNDNTQSKTNDGNVSIIKRESHKQNDSDMDEDTDKRDSIDISDAWLKEKITSLGDSKKKPCNFDLVVSSPGNFKLKTADYSIERSQAKDNFKDNRNATITYGMARQKLIPYNRHKFGYQNHTKNSASKIKSSSTNLGVVQSRIAQLEKTPIGKETETDLNVPKKPAAQPTYLEKTPIPVTSLSETTVQLSKPVCRRLKYKENKKTTSPQIVKNRDHPIVEDCLVVSSFEINDTGDTNSACKIYKPVPVPTPVDKDLRGEEKNLKDSIENEKLKNIERDHTKMKTDDLSNKDPKLPTPGSENSFEIIGSVHDSLDLSTSDDALLEESILDAETNLMMALDLSGTECGKSDSADVSNISPVVHLKRTRQISKDSGTDLTMDQVSDLKKETLIISGNSGPTSNSRYSLGSALNSMNSSTESNTDSILRSHRSSSVDRSTVSGKYTPSIGSNRGELDQDFFDDEISDQPGLVFGDPLDASFYGDDDLFSDDLISSSPSLLATKLGATRSRAESACTLSSIGGDDLMLDYDPEDQRASIGYEEAVRSPVAVDIYNEFEAILAEVKKQSPNHQCTTRESSSSSGSCVSGHRTLTDGGDAPVSLELDGSDPLKKGGVFKPPRQGSGTESEGTVTLDRTSLHYICQDVTTIKTLLLRLKRTLQVADTINPFDVNLKNSLYLSLGVTDAVADADDSYSMADITQENVDLQRQVIFLKQQLEDSKTSMKILHRQLAQALHQSTANPLTSSTESTSSPSTANSFNSTSNSCNYTSNSLNSFNSTSNPFKSTANPHINAATQTERSSYRHPVLNLRAAEDGMGPTVSFENTSEDFMKHGASAGVVDVLSTPPNYVDSFVR